MVGSEADSRSAVGAAHRSPLDEPDERGEPRDMSTLAWLGTGLLGAAFVEAALTRGERVVVWNRTASKAEALVARGAIHARSVAEAVAGADRVHLCLSDDDAVDHVLGEVLPTLGASVPIVDHTTVSPTRAQQRAARLASAGIGFLACPVFMAPVNARGATGRMLCAGPAALVEQLAPALRLMTGELVLLGVDVSRPYAVKLVGNALIISVTAALADALAVGTAMGLSAQEIHAFAAGFPLGNVVQGRGAKMAEGDYTPSFELSMARKDVRLMLEATGNRPMSTIPGIAMRMDTLLAEGHGDLDFGVLAKGSVPQKLP